MPGGEKMLSQQKIEPRILWKELLKTNLKIFKLFQKKWFIEAPGSQFMAMISSQFISHSLWASSFALALF